jgi:hypothetical protein
MTQEEITKGRHLGDGVYASFDGYQIWLAANHHENKVVALESETFIELLRYQQDLRAHFAKEQSSG